MRSVLVQIIESCNFRCTHCSQDAPHALTAKTPGVPVDVLRERFSALSAAGVSRIRLTGGEPLSHPRLPEVLRLARSFFGDVSVVTNASLVPKHREELIAAKLSSVWISAYGLTSDSHKLVSGQPRDLPWLAGAAGMLTAAGIRVGLYAQANPEETGSLSAFLDLFANHGIHEIRFFQMLSTGRAANGDHEHVAGDGTSSAFLNGLRNWQTNRRIVAKNAMSIAVSMGLDQLDLFNALGFTIPKELGCWAATDDAWAQRADGKLVDCCLHLGQRRAAHDPTVAINWLHPSIRRSHCSAMPTYGNAKPAADFVCPLKYARLH
jgi:molybdenum cofactor biosynthesis enzyme MoaA